MTESQKNPQAPIGYPNYGLGTSADSICDAMAKLEAPAPTGCIQVGSAWRYEPPSATPTEPAPTSN